MTTTRRNGRFWTPEAETALPKFALPGMAWQGYYLDTEGNTIGIHQPDDEPEHSNCEKAGLDSG